MKLKLVKKNYKQLSKNAHTVGKDATPMVAGGFTNDWITTICTETNVTQHCNTVRERTCNTCNTVMC
ncbi:hypothetical protein [Pseudoalteromonas obscura]|uniref:Uncharacterized protein n=1 Tax=Pseudoalteromonas obscura TaxID=3048491 RepID=A0ABT7EIX6_9GAMM|nr:hypothetical protein [Pseudoalteromonas sp. P94(2023)]MDK2594980.1 hypothetical protein [Pseudoalteromonas sp. P94(2023)]